MTQFFKNEEANLLLHDTVFQKFARNSGLMKHEFFMHFDPNLEHNGCVVDYMITAGKTVHIAFRCVPTEQRFFQLCRHVFGQNLRPFLRFNLSIVPKKDADKWVSLVVFNPESDPGKKVSHRSYRMEVLNTVKLTDKKTRKSVELTVSNGNAFETVEKALKLLYGERLS